MILASVEGSTVVTVAPISGGTVTIQTSASKKVLFGGKGVYSGDIKVLVAGTSFGSYTQVDPTTITISPKMVQKCKAEGKLILGVGDSGTTTSPVSFAQGQTTTTSTITIKISDAGQNKVQVA